MQLDKKQVDWAEEFENWDTTCPFCKGGGEVSEDNKDNYEEDCEIGGCCQYCQDGYLEMIWNTVWDLGYMSEDAVSEEKQRLVEKETNCHVVLNTEEGNWYLTLSGCGMDLTPDLCYAMKLLGFGWLPMGWIDSLDKRYTGGLSEEKHKEVMRLAISTLESVIEDSKGKIEGWRS